MTMFQSLLQGQETSPTLWAAFSSLTFQPTAPCQESSEERNSRPHCGTYGGASVPSQLGSETEAEGCGSDGPSSFQQASAMDCHPCRPCSPAEHTPAPLPPPLLPPPLAAWGVYTVGTQGTQILNWYDEKGDLLNQCRFSRQRESAK